MNDFLNAKKDWENIEGVIEIKLDISNYVSNTIQSKRNILASIIIDNREAIPKIVNIASKYKIPLYTISTGNNWGYGSSLPVDDDCVILDLSNINKVLEFNPELGYVTVEPGVTQQILYDFLQNDHKDFLVPTTGAGPSCSLIGNILERGYGITPHTDHFSSLTSLEAVLADGSIYRSPLEDFKTSNVSKIFKWGIGPYLDGIFTQSNFGIVTKATFLLAKKNDYAEIFSFKIDSEDQFELALPLVKEIKTQLGSLIGGINLMNAHRVEAMFSNKQSLWTGLGSLYAPKELLQSAKKHIKKTFLKANIKIKFINKNKVALLKKLSDFTPPFFNLKKKLNQASLVSESFLKVLDGTPLKITLKLAYKNDKPFDLSKDLNPAKDNCGLIWFSPLVPIQQEIVLQYIKRATQICNLNSVKPIITLTTISEICFNSTIPILFDKEDENSSNNAKKCYKELMELNEEIGIAPYRLNIDSVKKFYSDNSLSSIKLIHKIKRSIDPDMILSPGRYS